VRSDDRRPQQLIERVTEQARAEVIHDGVISVNTALELTDLGIDPDALQDRLQNDHL